MDVPPSRNYPIEYIGIGRSIEIRDISVKRHYSIYKEIAGEFSPAFFDT